MPLSRPPPRDPAAGHSPPQENQMATPHTMSAPVATTTAAPTVCPSKRLGLPLLTARKLDPRPVGRSRPETQMAHVARKPCAGGHARWAPIAAKGELVRPGLTKSPFDNAPGPT